MSEFQFIDWLRAELARGPEARRALPIPPGDDCAEVEVAGGTQLYAADMLMDGVHFDLRTTAPELAGRKALAVNLSDVAAMAGTPDAVTVCLALPRRGGRALAEQVMQGLVALAREHGVAVAGGDTNSWDGPLVISVAITGTPHPRGSVTRGGAKPGDGIYVTGPLGGSIHGRHLTFAPRLKEARELHERYGLSAMIDLSDGLGSDLGHVLTMSGVGARLGKGAIPIHDDVARHGANGRTPIEHALGDGEDFELCFTTSARDVRGAIRIGEITADRSFVFDDGTPVTVRGYSHGLA